MGTSELEVDLDITQLISPSMKYKNSYVFSFALSNMALTSGIL